MSSIPDPEVTQKAKRRKFTAAYKLKILKEADTCEAGEIGALLRREGLYSSHLSTWRKQRRAGELKGLTPKPRGVKAKAADPATKRMAQLERENQRLQKQLKDANTIIEVQKKLSDLLEPNSGEREKRMNAVKDISTEVGVTPACRALDYPRSSYYRKLKPRPTRQARVSPRALSDAERQKVLDVLNSERFADKAPAQVYASLLDEGEYLCSISTMYRILAQNNNVRERRNQLRHPEYQKPELLASKPNELWSWDITKPSSLS